MERIDIAERPIRLGLKTLGTVRQDPVDLLNLRRELRKIASNFSLTDAEFDSIWNNILESETLTTVPIDMIASKLVHELRTARVELPKVRGKAGTRKDRRNPMNNPERRHDVTDQMLSSAAARKEIRRKQKKLLRNR